MMKTASLRCVLRVSVLAGSAEGLIGAAARPVVVDDWSGEPQWTMLMRIVLHAERGCCCAVT